MIRDSEGYKQKAHDSEGIGIGICNKSKLGMSHTNRINSMNMMARKAEAKSKGRFHFVLNEVFSLDFYS